MPNPLSIEPGKYYRNRVGSFEFIEEEMNCGLFKGKMNIYSKDGVSLTHEFYNLTEEITNTTEILQAKLMWAKNDLASWEKEGKWRKKQIAEYERKLAETLTPRISYA